MCFDRRPVRLSCVFLANHVPKCQMSSGLYGPIFTSVSYNAKRVYLLNVGNSNKKFNAEVSELKLRFMIYLKVAVR